MQTLSSFRKNKSNSFLRLQRRILSFLGIFLGFSSVVVAQYGVIEYNYSVPLKLVTECGTPAKGIKVDIDDKYNYNNPDLITNDKGLTSIMLYGHRSFTSLANDMAFHDPQGLLKDTLVKQASWKREDFKAIREGGWTNDYVKSDTLLVTLFYKDKAPCKEEPKDTTPPKDTIIKHSILASRDEIQHTVLALNPEDTGAGNNESPDRLNNSNIIVEPVPFDALLFPNPSYGAFSVKLTLPEEGDVTINIYDLNGKLIFSETHPSCPLTSTLSANPGVLSQGTYMVQFLHKSAVQTRRLVIQR
ncbi:MAG: T9SS type A sorting domain-containing protein [Bacteroidota bacterium]